jgi:hypothetical protein
VNQNSEIKLEKPSNWRGTKIRLDWREGRNSTPAWNEICIWAIEQYGMPGSRFTWHPTEDYMDFYFHDEKDAVHFMLRWS